jgi:hypothetical protein
MRKSTLFISAVLTTFVMAMLAGVASAYQDVISTTQLSMFQAQNQTNGQTMVKAAIDAVPTATEVQPVNWTPEEAAGLAAQVLGREDLYSVEVADLNGETVFMVTFSSGDLVYVSLDGQIRSIGKVQVETVVVNSGKGGGGGGGGGNNNVSQAPAPSQNHEEHEHQENHEEHEEHDD